jgi:hypothetical protein
MCNLPSLGTYCGVVSGARLEVVTIGKLLVNVPAPDEVDLSW